jgi:hypothetical protein
MSLNGSESPPQEILTLFMVVVDLDGSSRVVLNNDERFLSHRLANPKDVYPALANCLADWQGMKTAEAVFAFQMQAARQTQEAQQAEEERTRE